MMSAIYIHAFWDIKLIGAFYIAMMGLWGNGGNDGMVKG